ncbi:MAG: hypothetical protein P3X24_000625 [bacterium]|nr:hypothetical protein [bacterium]
MQRRKAGATVRAYARRTRCAFWFFAVVGILISLLVIYLLLDSLLPSFGGRGTPRSTVVLWVILLGLGPLAWAVQRLFWLQRRAAQGARGEERVGAALDMPLAWLLATLEKQPPRLSPTQAHQVASVIRQLYASSR